MSHDALLSPGMPGEAYERERPLDAATLEYGERLTETLLGDDRLYREESEDGDGLAVLNMDYGGRLRPEEFEGYRDAADRLIQLRDVAAQLAEPDRRVYYEELCRSTLAFVTWRGEELSFRDQLTGFLHVPAEPASDRALARLRDGMDELLGRMGFRGGLAARFRAWEEDRRVPAESVADVAAELLEAAWDRTEERVMRIPADRSEGMRVEPVRDVAYTARCD